MAFDEAAHRHFQCLKCILLGIRKNGIGSPRHDFISESSHIFEEGDGGFDLCLNSFLRRSRCNIAVVLMASMSSVKATCSWVSCMIRVSYLSRVGLIDDRNR